MGNRPGRTPSRSDWLPLTEIEITGRNRNIAIATPIGGEVQRVNEPLVITSLFL